MVRAIPYTTPSIRAEYERLVVIPRLRGAEREAIVLRLNNKQQRNNERNREKRAERAFLREQAELFRLAQIQQQVAAQIQEQTQKEIARRVRANEKRREQRQRAKELKQVTQQTIQLWTPTNDLYGQLYQLWKSNLGTFRLIGKDIDVEVNPRDSFADWKTIFYAGGVSDNRLLIRPHTTYRIMRPSAIPAIQIRQFFAEGISHCVFTPILRKLRTIQMQSASVATRKKYDQYIRAVERTQQTYLVGRIKEVEEVQHGIVTRTMKHTHGVSHEELEDIARVSGLKIVLHDTLQSVVHTYNEDSKRGTLSLRNSDFNHVEDNILVRQDEPIDIEREEMISRWNAIKDTNQFHVEGDIRDGCPHKLYTLEAVYRLHDPHRELYDKMNELAYIKESRLYASEYPEVNDFVKAGRIIHSSPCRFSDQEATGHLDMRHAYTQFKQCSFYRGFLGVIHEWRQGPFPLSFVQEHVGIYQVQITKLSHDLFRPLGIEQGHMYVLPSPEIEYLVSRGVELVILAGVMGATTDFDFPSSMLEKVNGIRHYAKWSGMLAMERTYESYTFRCKESLVCDLKYRYGENMVLYYHDTGLCTVRIPKKHFFTTHHVMAFLTSYVRIQMMQKMETFKPEQLVRVVLDGIYFVGEGKEDALFQVKPVGEDSGYSAPWYQPCFTTPESWTAMLFSRNTLIIGQGGCGKSYLALQNKGFHRPLYVVPQHVLGQDGRKKYGCDYTTIHRLIGIDCESFKDKFYYPPYLVIDEITQLDAKVIDTVFEMYPLSRIILLGDINEKGQWFQCRNGKPGNFSTVWKPHSVDIMRMEGDRRSQDDTLRQLKLDCRSFMESIFVDGDGEEVYHMKQWITQRVQTVSFWDAVSQFQEGDIWLAATHRTNQELLLAGVQSGFYKQGGLIQRVEGPGFVRRGSFTIHATQGRTISEGKIFISINDSFEYAMLYTALSRAVHFEQLVFVS